MSGRTTSVEVLLAALKIGAGGQARLAQLAVLGVDQGDLAVTALALGLAPLLHYRLEGWGSRLPDARAQAKLDFARQTEVARQMTRRAQLAEVRGRLPAQPVVLTG